MPKRGDASGRNERNAATLAAGARMAVARLAAETRTYTVDESVLAEWVSGEQRFHVSAIEFQRGAFVITLTTAKVGASVELTQRPGGMVKVSREEDRGRGPSDLVPVEELGGPGILDDEGAEEAGAPAVERILPASAGRRGDRRLVRSRREIALEAQKANKPAPEPRIVHRDDGDDDPVPSAIPR